MGGGEGGVRRYMFKGIHVEYFKKPVLSLTHTHLETQTDRQTDRQSVRETVMGAGGGGGGRSERGRGGEGLCSVSKRDMPEHIEPTTYEDLNQQMRELELIYKNK